MFNSQSCCSPEAPKGGALELTPEVTTSDYVCSRMLPASVSGDRDIFDGDAVMARCKYPEQSLSTWYTDDQLRGLHSSLDRIRELQATIVMPGHDPAFAPSTDPR